jgi:spermidine/putrescine transport system ATP-binding protein
MSGMVKLDRVSKRFGSFIALHEIEFEILEGEFMTFLGPSGCGKTTCLRLISGFDTPTSGSVRIAGEDVTHLPPYKRDVNQVFQSYALFPHLNIYDNVAFGLRIKKIPAPEVRRRVDRVLEMTGLTQMADRRPSQLSGGQRQRVALARAIVCEPKVLLLDEPFSALDAKLRQQMRMELKQLQKQLGITFVFVTHDQEEALTMSDRIAVLNAGRIEQLGTVNEIYHQPKTRFVAEFIGQTNILEALIISHSGDFYDCLVGRTHRIRVYSPGRVFSGKVLVSIRPEKIEIFRAQPVGANVFEGTISVKIFKGAVDDLIITSLTQPSFQLRAMHANVGEHINYHEGERVFFRFAPEDVNILQSDSNS